MQLCREDDADSVTFTLRIERSDWLEADPLNGFDQALLADCTKDDATIADRLLGLELIARRIEQGRARHPADAAGLSD